MLRSVLLAAVAVCAVATSLPRGKFELFEYNPMASSAAMVVSGNARFSVLTDRVRLQLTSFSSLSCVCRAHVLCCVCVCVFVGLSGHSDAVRVLRTL